MNQIFVISIKFRKNLDFNNPEDYSRVLDVNILKFD